MNPANFDRVNNLYEEREQLVQMRAFIMKRPPNSLEFAVFDISDNSFLSKEVISEKLVPYIEKAICERLTDINKEAEAL